MTQPSTHYPEHHPRPPMPSSGTYGASAINKAPPGTLPSELLELLTARPDWQRAAACRGAMADEDAPNFFPLRGESAEPARQVCLTCPVQRECADFALGYSLNELVGVWGAMSGRDRVRARRTAA